ncbi:hypothetical protein HDV63DRAFT_26687 [Trichoderma sp. SZMC 28014]
MAVVGPHTTIQTLHKSFESTLWLLSASGFLASQRRLVFQDNMGAAGRNDTVPEMGFGVWCWTGEQAALIRRIPRPDRVMPVARAKKGFGIRGRIHAASVGVPTATLLPINGAPRVDLNLHGLMLCLGFSPTDLLEAFPGFSTVCWLPLAICSSPLARPWRRCLFPLCRSFIQFAILVFTNIFPHRQCLDKLLNRRLNLEATLIFLASLNRSRSY